MYFSETLGKTITDKIFRLVRMGARPEWHIYGMKRKEYHRRMHELGLLAKEADILRNDFKKGLLTKITLILRRVKFSLSLCCVNVSPGTIIRRMSGDISYCEVKRSFNITIDKWVNKITTDAWNEYSSECDLLSDGNVWEAEKCDNDVKGFIKGIKIISTLEIKSPDESLQDVCNETKVVFDLKYKTFGVGAWNKWSDYKKTIENGVITYAD